MGRPRIPLSVVGVGLRAVARGATLVEAAVLAGVSDETLSRWIAEEDVVMLRDRKVRHLLATECDVLVSSNPGCLMQIGSGLEAAGRPMRILHFVELLDAAIGKHA